MSNHQNKHSKLLFIIPAFGLIISVSLIGLFLVRQSQAIANDPVIPSNTPRNSEDPQSPVPTQAPQWPTITPKLRSNPTKTPIQEQYEQPAWATEPTSSETLPTEEPTIMPTDNTNQYDFSSNPFTIGYSVESRPLDIYQFGTGSDHRLIVAGIHGGYEYNTTNLAYELINYIQNNPEIIPESITLFLLPSLNPDGLNRSYGYAGRANANNVDLNRNWDLNWKESWNPSGCWAYLEISGGTGPHSEPEIQALDTFIKEMKISTLISYHSAALGIFPGNYPNHLPSIQLAEAIAAQVPYPYPPINTGCEMTGQFVDYTATLGITSLDIELTNHKDSDFEINLDVLETFLAWGSAQ